MRNRNRAPLGVSVVAIFVTIFAMLLFGGMAARADEAQSAATQSANVVTEAQSSSGVATANCIPRPISAGEITNQYVRTTDGSHEFTAYEAVEFGFSLLLEEGHCEGDSIVFTVPSELGVDGSFMPVEMKTRAGVTVATARYSSDRTITVTLTSAVEDTSKHNFQASAWWKVHMEDVLVPGEIRELEWNIGGIVRRTPITVGTCPNCNKLGEGPSKWGVVSSLKPWNLTVTIVTPTAEYDDQPFTITDRSTSSGQDFACPDPTVGQAGVYDSANFWGKPQYSRFVDVQVESCDSENATFKLTLNKGEKARFDVLVNIEPEDRGPWTDLVSITSQDRSWEVSAHVTRKQSGGNADYDPRPTPTPSTTPAPSPSPTPTPAPSPSPTPTPVTPTPAPSASPSPSPTPSTSPEPTPSTTPEPSPSATPSTSPAPTPEPTSTPSPSTTPSATPAPARQHKKLAITGASGDTVTSAVALVALGGFLIWVRRRQMTHPEG